MKGTEHFKRTIKEYLDGKARTDELFRRLLCQRKTKLGRLYHIHSQSSQGKRLLRNDRREVWSLAIHYYDEDNIDVGKPISCGVVVNHKVELTEEEKAQARKRRAESLSGGRNAQDTATPQQAEADRQSCTEYPNGTLTLRFLTMKARTKFQHQVVAANGRLLPITEKQAEWAFRHTVGHYAFRTPSGQRPASIAVIGGTRQRRSVAIARTATPN